MAGEDGGVRPQQAPGDWILKTMEQALAALQERQRAADQAVVDAMNRIQGIRDEASAAAHAVKEQERAVDRQRKRWPGSAVVEGGGSRQLTAGNGDAPSGTTARARVREVLHRYQNGLNLTALAGEARVPYGTLSTLVQLMLSEGEIVRITRGVYALVREPAAA